MVDVYEIILTDKCTRSCDFCYIKNTNYIENIDNIKQFIQYIKSISNKKIQINLFGGEPLLNIAGVYYIIDELKNNLNIDIHLYTNGDLLNNVLTKYISHLYIHLTAYDIFVDIKKYNKLINACKFSKNISLSYTFTENDIDKLYYFLNICEKLNVDYHINFSHNLQSWKNISVIHLYNKLYCIYNKLFNDFYNSSLLYAPSSINKYFSRCIQLIFDKNIKQCFCTTEPKHVYYKGNFIGPCIRLCNAKSSYVLKRCQKCLYNNACFKSCVAEYINDDIPEKLCIFEKSAFDALFYNIKQYLSQSRMQQIIKYELIKHN